MRFEASVTHDEEQRILASNEAKAEDANNRFKQELSESLGMGSGLPKEFGSGIHLIGAGMMGLPHPPTTRIKFTLDVCPTCFCTKAMLEVIHSARAEKIQR
jgi:hypothetical protein